MIHFYSIRQVARMAKIEPLTVVFRISTKQLKARTIGDKFSITKEDAKVFVQQIRAERKGQRYIP